MSNSEHPSNKPILELAALVLVFGFSAALIWFDQYCKALALLNLVPGQVVSVLNLPFAGDVCILTLTWNTGAFLGIGAGNSGWFHVLTMIAIPAIALLAMSAWLFRPLVAGLSARPKIRIGFELRIGLGLFIAGGAGNLIDRIREGKVVDFLNFGVGSLRTGIMNVADLYIALGLAALIVYYFRNRTRKV